MPMQLNTPAIQSHREGPLAAEIGTVGDTGDLFGGPPPVAINARPAGYDGVVALAKSLNCPSGELIALSRNNDPFFCGTLANRRDADWFLLVWKMTDMDQHYRVHLRQMHYKLVSQAPPPLMPSGKPEHPAIDVDPPDESGWLFDSSRHYLEQIAVYKARRSLVGNDADQEVAL